jgi:hypothetical protein
MHRKLSANSPPVFTRCEFSFSPTEITYTNILDLYGDFHSGFAKYWSLPECYTISTGKFTSVSKDRNAIITCRFLRCKKSRLGLLDPHNKENTIFPNVGKLLPDGMAQHSRRIEISAINLPSELFPNSMCETFAIQKHVSQQGIQICTWTCF